MESTSQRQYRPSKGSRPTSIIFENLRGRFLMGVSVLLVYCVVHTTVFAANYGTTVPATGLATRTFKIVPEGAGCAGFFSRVRVDLESEGNEVSGYFSIEFDENILSNPVVELGADVPVQWDFVINTLQLAQGRIGIAADGPTSRPMTLSPPDRRFLNIRFDVAPGSGQVNTLVRFIPNNENPPTNRNTSSASGALLPTLYQDANVTIGGTACSTSSNVSVSGRVLNSSGSGVRGAEVYIADSEGNRRKVLTSSLGYYQINDVAAGKSYVIGVASRRYRFEPRALQVTDNLTNLDFVGIE